MNERYCTTGQFEKLGHGFRQHCGPTALTNLVLTLRPEATSGAGGAETPEDLFLRLARLGQRRLNYVNLKLPFRLGGTSDLLCRSYLRAALRESGLRDAEAGPRRRATPQSLRAALRRGSLVYLQLRRHPRYGSHHLLCYGLDPDGSLRLADGWTDEPARLAPGELGRAWMIEISLSNK